MEVKEKKMRYILQYHFDQGDKAEQAAKKICAVYGPDTVSNVTAKRWFRRFRSGNMDVHDDTPTFPGPLLENADEMEKTVESDRPATTSNSIPREPKISQESVWNRDSKTDPKKRKKNVVALVPHVLTQKNISDRIDACDSWLKRNETDPFLERLVTGGEKWLAYAHGNSVLLSVWWDCKGVIHYEFLPSGNTINSDLYCQQLTRLKEAVDKKRPELAVKNGVVFHEDNAKPHTSLSTRRKLREFGWAVISHPPNSPDLAPCEYHLFRHLGNFLDGKKLPSREACEKEVVMFFMNREEDFFNQGIMELPSKWTKVVKKNGEYLD